jgi:hypothetical protein
MTGGVKHDPDEEVTSSSTGYAKEDISSSVE